MDARLQGLVAAYRAAFDGWADLIDRLDGLDGAGQAWSAPTGCPGWDVHDQLAHVVALEHVMLGDPPDEAVLADDLPHVRDRFGRFMEVGVEARRRLDPSALVAEAREVFARRLDQLEAMDPADLERPGDGPAGMRLPGAKLLRTRIFDVASHEYDARRATGLLDAPGGPHVPIAVEQVVRAWVHLLPSRLAGADAVVRSAADGGPVLGVEVDGTEVARIALGAGTLHRGADAPPSDAVLATDVAGLLAIGGGRSDAPTPDQVGARGDVALVHAVLAAGTITP